jgi:hypothetical protein
VFRTHREDTSLSRPSAGAEPARLSFAASDRAVSGLSPQAMVWADGLVEALRTDYLFEHVAVFLIGLDRRLTLAGQRWGSGEDVGAVIAGEWTVPLDGSVTGRVYRTGQPSLISDVRLDPEYRSYPGSTGRSELAVPIRVADEVVGVVNLESPRVNAYGIRDLETVVAALEVAAGAFPSRAAATGALPGGASVTGA